VRHRPGAPGCRLGDNLQPRVLLTQVGNAAHMIYMPLGQNKITHGVVVEVIEITLDYRRLKTHTGIDLDITLRCLQQITIGIGFTEHDEIVNSLTAKAGRIRLHRAQLVQGLSHR